MEHLYFFLIFTVGEPPTASKFINPIKLYKAHLQNNVKEEKEQNYGRLSIHDDKTGSTSLLLQERKKLATL
jgi:hypothetical protein